MHRHSHPESATPHDPDRDRVENADVADAVVAALAVDDGVAHGQGPHHDPTVHTERESFSVTSQRCRGEYP
jgi:hypothetical protein